MMNRFDYIEQSSAYQSGLTCLSIICRHYGRYINLITTSTQEKSPEESLQQVSNKAGELGLSSIIGHLTVAKLSRITLPCILYWDNEYYVVLRKIKFNTYYVADPTKGLIKYSQAEVKQHCVNSHIANEEKVVAVFIKPTDEFYKQADAQNQLIKENSIWRYIKHLLSGTNRIL